MKRLKVQEVTGALKAAGFESSIRTRRQNRIGYAARQVNQVAVAVLSDRFDDPNEASKVFAQVLRAAGFKVQRPFEDKTILGVTKE